MQVLVVFGERAGLGMEAQRAHFSYPPLLHSIFHQLPLSPYDTSF